MCELCNSFTDLCKQYLNNELIFACNLFRFRLSMADEIIYSHTQQVLMKIKQETSPLNILLADDDMDDRSFFDKALKEIPIDSNLTTLNNGEQLMEYLSAHAGQLPDVLFLDLSMPRKTGFECLAEIKENEKLKALTVIMFTTSFTRGFDLEENLRGTLMRMGAHDYIRKPAGFQELKEVIQHALISIIKKETDVL